MAYILFLYYGPIGYIASQEGVNYANYFVTQFDLLTPFNSIFILFYILAEFVIVLAVVLVRIRIGPELAVFQQLSCSVIVFLLINFSIFLLYPSSAIDLYGIPTIVNSHGWLEYLVTLMYRSTSPWNSNPSLHIGMSWFIYRFFSRYYKFWAKTIYLLWFIGMAIGTLVLKVHMLFNILFAILLAQLCFFIFMTYIPKEKYSYYLDKIPIKIRLFLYTLLIIILITFLTIHIHSIGWYAMEIN